MEFEFVGVVRSPVKEPVDEEWGKVVSEIHLEHGLSRGLIGLDQFSHVMIVFYLHESSFNLKTDLVRQPQGRHDMPMTGIFAQRAKHRPNPIGVTSVELLGVRGNVLIVKGLDAIDGTPVLDIKPYFPSYDRMEEVIVPDWVKCLMSNYF